MANIEKKPHANTGNTYAARENPKNDIFRVRCDTKFKENIQKIAKARGLSLSEWVTEAIESHIKNSN